MITIELTDVDRLVVTATPGGVAHLKRGGGLTRFLETPTHVFRVNITGWTREEHEAATEKALKLINPNPTITEETREFARSLGAVPESRCNPRTDLLPILKSNLERSS